MAEIENRNALALAMTNRDIAVIKLQAYEAAEYPAQVLALEQQITAAEDALNMAEQKVQFTERMHPKDFRTSAQLQVDLLAQTTARQKYADLKESLRVLKDHTHARTLAELTGAPTIGCAPLALESVGPRADASFDGDYSPDRVLEDGESLEVDGRNVVAIATPGHTSTSLPG